MFKNNDINKRPITALPRSRSGRVKPLYDEKFEDSVGMQIDN